MPPIQIVVQLSPNGTVNVAVPGGQMPPRHLFLMMMEEAKEHFLEKVYRNKEAKKIEIAPASFLEGGK